MFAAMAFALNIAPNPEFHCSDVEGIGIVMMLLGYDPDAGLVYFAAVELSPYDEGCPEFSFEIIERHVAEDRERYLRGGVAVAHIFSREEKFLISAVFQMLTAVLIQRFRPQKVYRCTEDTSPPEKALEKHYAISHVFLAYGYAITKTDLWHGKRMWWMERSREGDCLDGETGDKMTPEDGEPR